MWEESYLYCLPVERIAFYNQVFPKDTMNKVWFEENTIIMEKFPLGNTVLEVLSTDLDELKNYRQDAEEQLKGVQCMSTESPEELVAKIWQKGKIISKFFDINRFLSRVAISTAAMRTDNVEDYCMDKSGNDLFISRIQETERRYTALDRQHYPLLQERSFREIISSILPAWVESLWLYRESVYVSFHDYSHKTLLIMDEVTNKHIEFFFREIDDIIILYPEIKELVYDRPINKIEPPKSQGRYKGRLSTNLCPAIYTPKPVPFCFHFTIEPTFSDIYIPLPVAVSTMDSIYMLVMEELAVINILGFSLGQCKLCKRFFFRKNNKIVYCNYPHSEKSYTTCALATNYYGHRLQIGKVQAACDQEKDTYNKWLKRNPNMDYEEKLECDKIHKAWLKHIDEILHDYLDGKISEEYALEKIKCPDVENRGPLYARRRHPDRYDKRKIYKKPR